MKIDKKQLIHIIGIGGIGMSGIAEILDGLGYSIQGSDINLNSNILRLRKKRIKIFIGHKQENLKNVDLVVYSTAIKKNNKELKFANLKRIPSIQRSNILSQLVKLKNTIAISGSHGKTTTTSITASVLNYSGFKPTVINGGIINEYGTNTKLGSGKWMVVEADESDETFLKLSSTISVVTNIDKEHLEYYKNFSTLKKCFKKFITQVPFYGCAVVCYDDKYIKELIKDVNTTSIVKYGFNKDNDVRAYNVRYKDNKTFFDLSIKNDSKELKSYKNFFLPLLGKYNVQNALAAISVATRLNIPISKIKKSIASFKGVERRLTYIGTVGNVNIIEDYAHHPTEIYNVTSEIKKSYPKTKLITVFQPHRFSRVISLKKEFSKCFSCVDAVMVSEVYSAGEKKPKKFILDNLIHNISEKSKIYSQYFKNNDSVLKLLDHYNGNIIVLFVGAGTVTKWAHEFYKVLKKSYE